MGTSKCPSSLSDLWALQERQDQASQDDDILTRKEQEAKAARAKAQSELQAVAQSEHISWACVCVQCAIQCQAAVQD